MSAPLESLESYSLFVYALRERHQSILSSTLCLAPIGATLARVEGQIECANDVPAPGINFDSPNLDTVLNDVRQSWPTTS
jgi:hypothetical protein